MPVKKTIDILKDMITKTPESVAQDVISITKLTLHTYNYFMYNSKYYTRKQDLPMGSPVSSINSEKEQYILQNRAEHRTEQNTEQSRTQNRIYYKIVNIKLSTDTYLLMTFSYYTKVTEDSGKLV